MTRVFMIDTPSGPHAQFGCAAVSIGEAMPNKSVQRPKRRGCLSRYKGVTPDRGVWRAQIRVAGENEFLGHFDDEREAARAFDQRSRQVYGRFAVTNRKLGLLR